MLKAPFFDLFVERNIIHATKYLMKFLIAAKLKDISRIFSMIKQNLYKDSMIFFQKYLIKKKLNNISVTVKWTVNNKAFEISDIDIILLKREPLQLQLQ